MNFANGSAVSFKFFCKFLTQDVSRISRTRRKAPSLRNFSESTTLISSYFFRNSAFLCAGMSSNSNSNSKSKRSFKSMSSNPSSSNNSSDGKDSSKKKKTAQKTLGMAWGANSLSSSHSAFRNSPFSDFGRF